MNLILILGLAIASTLDWKYRKVPNSLTFSLILIGLIYKFSFYGLSGLSDAFLGLLCGLALLFIPFAIGGMGGGDVKLLGAIGVFTGPLVCVEVFLASAIFGGVISLIESIRHKQLKNTLERIKTRLLHIFIFQKPMKESAMGTSENNALTIPYAIMLSLGYVAIQIMGGFLS